MSYTNKIFGNNSTGNLRFEKDARDLADLLTMDPRSDSNRVYATANLQGETWTLVLNGQFSAGLEGPKLSRLEGLLASLEVFKNGVLQETTSVSPPTSVPFYNLGQFVPSLYMGNDRFECSPTANLTDAINGFDGDDTFIGYGDPTFDWFYGGNGVDTSVYRGPFREYELTRSRSIWDDRTPDGSPKNYSSPNQTSLMGWQILDEIPGRDGHDQLHETERLIFQDMALALDLDGHAGTVAKVLGAVWGPLALQNKSYVGIGLSLLDQQMPYQDLLDLALTAALGGMRTDATVVDLLYKNLMDVSLSPKESEFYVGLLKSGAHTQTSLAQMAADLDLNLTRIDLVGLAQTGLAYEPWVNPG